MNSSSAANRKEVFADDLTLRIDERGNGRPILILHGAAGPRSVVGLAEALAEQGHVFVPTHPGFEGEPRPEWFNSVDDLAFTYLDLLERLNLQDVVVIGFSFGGWIASEMTVWNTTRLSGLILVDAAGIQVDGYPINVPTGGPAPAPQGMPARAQALRAYTGQNGFSNPKLRRRLGRVKIPALCIWGENDSIVAPGYGRAYAQSFPNARFTLIPRAGHTPQIDQPEPLLVIVKEFVIGTNTHE